jgi:HD-GYP domain-containing protein (c-di-GMP phosphodiesterase class II)
MIDCYVFFSDPLMVGKVSQLISRIHNGINIIKVIDAKQILNVSKNEQIKKIILTDDKNYNELSSNNISDQFFTKALIIDEINEEINESNEKVTYINKKYLITRIGTVLDDFVKSTFGEASYLPVQITKVKTEEAYPCEIFVRLSATKYVKVLNKNESFAPDRLQKLLFKNVQFLYIKAEDYSAFNKVLYNREDQPKLDLVSTEVSAVESLHSYITDLGFDPKIIDMTKNLQKSLEEKFTHKFMKKLFARFNDMEGSFLYNHSYLTSVIALTTGKKFNWMNFENREKIYMGCILHDLGYIHKENALRGALGKRGIQNLSPEEKEDILNHPMKFAKHLAQIDNIHQDVIKIVKDHHGVHGEDSYPKPVYPPEINLIFALFILSHELAIGLYGISFKEEKIPTLLDEVCERFNKGNYKKIIPEFREAIEETFLSKKAA